ncbi:MAG: B12-binding domain-containing radical SAM protein, partial [Deltaproteobacteria bacterium]|nr:B12-binding domain-containing radical SAM protein [Deltaproteobacteria bacterium]
LVGARFAHIPLGLATLAALTPAGVDVSIFDENVEDGPATDVRGDVVAMTGIFCQRRRLFELADRLRARGVHVCIGGPIASDAPAECRAHADTVFEGEAEYTWPRFCADFAAGHPAPRYAQDAPVDMRDSPAPRLDLLRCERYSSACIQATRGCPYRCEFCDVPSKLGTRPRTKPVARVLDEVRAAVAQGFESAFFVDDMFIAHKAYAKELLRALAAFLPTLPRPIYFYTQVTLNVARDPELLALFRAARFKRFFIGVETSDVGALDAMAKRQNTELDIRDAIARIHAHDIIVWAGIILGLDGDTAQTFATQRDFVRATGVVPTLIGLLQAMPGAPLWDRARREGRVRALPDIVGSAALGPVEAMPTTNLVHDTLPHDELLTRWADTVRAIYHPDAFADALLVACARGSRQRLPPRGLINARTARIVARTLSWYLRHPDPAVRRLPRRLLGAWALGRAGNLEELVFHLALYKHLSTFYTAAADACDAAVRPDASAA